MVLHITYPCKGGDNYSFLLTAEEKEPKKTGTPKAPYIGGCNRSSSSLFHYGTLGHQSPGVFFAPSGAISNTMLKHSGYGAAGDEQAPISEGGWKRALRAGRCGE